MCEDLQKRKCEDTSPSLAASPMKKPRNFRRMKLVDLAPQEPEDTPECSETTAPSRDKEAINNYLLQVGYNFSF